MLNRFIDGGLLQFYISSKWFCKFKTFAEPGSIHNQDFLCPHGGVQPLKIERLEEVCLPVSAVVWEALYARQVMLFFNKLVRDFVIIKDYFFISDLVVVLLAIDSTNVLYVSKCKR